MFIYGVDYEPYDEICIPDYIHVSDLAQGHVDALHHLDQGVCSQAVTCGYGYGSNVREVIDAVEWVSSIYFTLETASMRSDDSAVLCN